ncbi:hypothetical protein P3X46_007015 [Hevea brasiliensis]|uniref:Leucine-rich repeat-containing N-terminal plant-type domain-containing protein n=1 Tax=Hevea brasiliensis TaxID=3981 RepID=A0ABQ9MT47_HEVBR|nr:hypothetical protein P3X46_007015 [Hevea brasiliensis]
MWATRSLKALSLSYDKLNDSLPNQSLCGLKHLEALDLIFNEFGGSLPQCLDNLTSIKFLDMSGNQLSGHISSSWPANLKYFGLSNNLFEGLFSFNLLANYSSFEVLWSHTIPEFLFHQFKLIVLDLSHNKMKGRFPNWLLRKNGGLEILNLMNNSVNGHLQEIGVKMLPNIIHLNLARNYLQDLSYNNFSGKIPEKLLSSCISLTSLKLSHNNFQVMFDLSNNRLHGEIPSWIGNFTTLYFLILRDNFLKGQISCEILPIGYLDVSHNSFSGSFPSCFNRNSLVQLNFEGNRFTGSIPKALFNMSTLNALDLSDNELSGTIPNNSGEFQIGLRVLLLRGNHLVGFIPNWFFSHNICFPVDLSQWLENFSSLTWIIFMLTLQKNGSLLQKYRASTYKNKALNYMFGLDLSSNNITGEIPYELGELSQIHALNLSHNQLTESIPGSFSNLSQLESLDLSYNNLSGEIPSKLIDLNFLEVFIVAYNNLSGRILDMKGQFSTFKNNSYEGNPLLCGPQVGKNCSGDDHETSSSQMESPHEISGKCFLVTFLMFFLAVITILYVNPYWQQNFIYYSRQYLFLCYYFLYDTFFKLFVHLYH